MTPESIRHHAATRTVEITWPQAASQRLQDAHLRRSCRCAVCTATRRATGQAPPVADDVRLLEIVPVGAYAVQLIFSDGHDRGIYPWQYLKTL